MPNSIALAQKYLPLLDEVYKASSRTAFLDETDAQFVGANAVKVFKTSMDGLGNYNRNTGYVDGSVTGTWETMTLTQDRGRSFMIDRMDNEETLDMAFGRLAGEFIRTKVVPEVDAYRFAKLAGTAGIGAATPADITVGTSDVPGFITEAERAMNEDEVPKEGRILFISESAYAGLRSKVEKVIMNADNTVNGAIEVFDGMRVIPVPQSRFYTAITLQNGSSSGQEAGGFVGNTTTGYPINFLIIHPTAVMAVTKHVLPRIFSPDVNQKADAWKFDYRVYHDLFVYENKVKGIYLHRGATKLS